MRYLHLLNLDTIGGVEELFIHFLENANAISDLKQKLLITGNRPHPFFVPRLQNADKVILEKYCFGMKAPKFLRAWQRRRGLAQADTIILWNRLEAITTAKRLIYYEHGASWIEPKSQKWNIFFENVDKVLANSFAAKRLLELKWNVKRPITVIENPLKPTVSRAKRPRALKNSLTLGYIGRLIPLKGVALLLHAMKHLPDARLRIAGDGPEKRALMQEAKRLNLNVEFCGVLSDVTSFYDSLDMLIVPSIREPLGLVAQEAALRGLPVIASCIDGLPEVVKHNATGITIQPTLELAHYPEFGATVEKLPDMVYDPISDSLIQPKLVDPEKIAHAVLSLANDPALYESMSRQALLFASLRPTFAHYTRALLDAFQA